MPRITGNNLITWGTGDVAGLGVVQTGQVVIGGEEVDLYDEDGETFCTIYFDDKDECEFEALFQSDIELPERGDEITIGGVVDAEVKTITLKWANKDAQRLSIKARKDHAKS